MYDDDDDDDDVDDDDDDDNNNNKMGRMYMINILEEKREEAFFLLFLSQKRNKGSNFRAVVNNYGRQSYRSFNLTRDTSCNVVSDHTPSIAFRHLPPKEGCRKPVPGVWCLI